MQSFEPMNYTNSTLSNITFDYMSPDLYQGTLVHNATPGVSIEEVAQMVFTVAGEQAGPMMEMAGQGLVAGASMAWSTTMDAANITSSVAGSLLNTVGPLPLPITGAAKLALGGKIAMNPAMLDARVTGGLTVLHTIGMLAACKAAQLFLG